MAADSVVFIAANRPVPGKEGEAASRWSDLMTKLDKLKAAGWFERMDSVGLHPHGGELFGFTVLFGERAKLDEMRRSKDFEMLVFTMMTTFLGFGVLTGSTMESVFENLRTHNIKM